jgi:protein required for attachment to host cells
MVAITWIVVSDGARCRILQHKGGSLKLTTVADFEGDHRPNREIDTGGQHYEASRSHHEMLKLDFVDRVLNNVQQRQSEGLFNSIIFICPPRILGIFRKKASKNLLNFSKAQIPKDLVHTSPIKIFEKLRSVLLPLEHLKMELGVRS